MFVTGDTDEETWNMLFNSSDVLDVSATARPTPVPTPVPYAITVDVRNQVTTVYGLDENGEYTVPVKQMVCSTGMKATPSDVGEWVPQRPQGALVLFSPPGAAMRSTGPASMKTLPSTA